jgi:SAM-dependent methyltransferase
MIRYMKNIIFKIIKERFGKYQIYGVNKFRKFFRMMLKKIMYPYGRFIKTPINLFRNKSKSERLLEIGPGMDRLLGFETINIVWGWNVDYIYDASKKLPFETGTFDLIYASHILEHTPWYDLDATFNEWVRVLKPNGIIEIWIPDGYKLSKLLCDIEEDITRDEWEKDSWRPFNEENNPYKWVNGRILYGAIKEYPSWHTAIITPKYLNMIMTKAGLVKITRMENSEVRGVDHGWINLGMRGFKP